MVKRFISIGVGVIAGYLMTLGVVQVVQAWGFWPDRETVRAANQVKEVMLLLNEHYVDEAKVDGRKLADQAIEQMVKTLDPYSEFMSADSYRQMEEEIDSKFGGIGVQIEQVDEQIVVVAPIAGTPGERAGILRGDVLVKVNDEDVRGWKLDRFIGKLRGKPGTEVSIVLERGQPPREIPLTLKREVIKVESVRDAEMLGDGVGYVRVALFAERTGDEFKAAVEKLREQGLRALVLDLRNNPGGLLTAAVEVAEVFFERGEQVVYTEGRKKESRSELLAEGSKPPLKIPVAILVNGGSASASEIVAGAMRDTKRAVLVGEKTFGKGSVQTIYPLSGNAGLRVTTAKYFTPSGVTIHEKGLEPDFKDVLTPEQEKAVFLARMRPDVTDPGAFEERFNVPMATDTQLATAVRELRSRLGLENAEWRGTDAAATKPEAQPPSPAPTSVEDEAEATIKPETGK